MKLPRHPVLFLLTAMLLLPACGTNGKRLHDTERAHLKDASAIHVFYYDTPLPQVRSTDKNAPTPAAVRKSLAADPAAQVATQFARALARQEKLRNVQTPQSIARPVAGNPREFRDRLQDGLVLELWVDDWTLGPVAAEPRYYTLALTVQTRLSRVKDGRRLWTAEGCRVNGSRDIRLAPADLTQGTRLRKALIQARDQCAHQLLRDFIQRPER